MGKSKAKKPTLAQKKIIAPPEPPFRKRNQENY